MAVVVSSQMAYNAFGSMEALQMEALQMQNISQSTHRIMRQIVPF